MTLPEEIGIEIVDRAQKLEEQMEVEPIRPEQRPELEAVGVEKALDLRALPFYFVELRRCMKPLSMWNFQSIKGGYDTVSIC